MSTEDEVWSKAEAALHNTLGYDPKAVFFEECSKILDSKYTKYGKPLEEEWAALPGGTKQGTGEIAGRLTLDEFKAMSRSLARSLNSAYLYAASLDQAKRGEAERSVFYADLKDRMHVLDSTSEGISIDPVTATVRHLTKDDKKADAESQAKALLDELKRMMGGR